MQFLVKEDILAKYGSAKAFCDSDKYGNTHWIPRSMIKIAERIEPNGAHDRATLVVDIPDWLIRKNGIPVFALTNLQLYR